MTYMIKSPDDLIKQLENDIKNDQTKGQTYTMTNDIDFKDCESFTPLGNGTNHTFDGTLNGNGYTIKNLKINTPKTYNLGLFNIISEYGIVKNLRMESISIEQNLTDLQHSSTSTQVGIIAAVCRGNIENCSARGSIIIQTETDNCCVGGLCGSLPWGKSNIIGSWADVSISFSQNKGENEENAGDKKYSVGGIVGSTNGTVSQCHSRSELFLIADEMVSYKAGGICGAADSCANVEACYNIGYIHSRVSDNDVLGGITGTAELGSQFSNCYYLKGCILSNNLEQIAKEINAIGLETSWGELTTSSDIITKLGEKFEQTNADGYTYTPNLKAFSSDDSYLMALCTPIFLSFSQSAYQDSSNPIKVSCELEDCTISKVSLTAVKSDSKEEDIGSLDIDGCSFSCDLGNNKYMSYYFELTLVDKYNRSVTMPNAHITNNLRIPLTYIENPEFKTGSYSNEFIGDKSISGFVEIPEKTEKYNYELFRYHWVGNGSGPVVITYYADFSAKVSCATDIEVKQKDNGTVIGCSISETEDLTEVHIGRLSRQNAPYSYDSLNFTAKNGDITASVEWIANKQAIHKDYYTAQSEKTIVAESNDSWEYPLMQLIWCMTNKCNLHCRHCAFKDIHTNMEELNDSEIRSVVSDIINLGVKRVTLSGGEILLSDYWYETAKSLSQAGVEVSLITNGTMIDHDCAEKIKRAGVVSVSVSIDDFKDSKDTIRGIGSYENAVAGVKYLKAENIPVSIITTVNALNLSRLDEMRSDFTAIGADSWCLKPIYPVGEASRNKELWLDECDINKVMEFCYSAMFVQGIPVVPAMAFEAHSKKGAAVQQFLYGDAVHTEVHGPYAGIFSAQLHPNGNLVGDCMCLSDYAAGNVKERSLSEIWRDKSSFRVLREFDSSMLSGYCGMCDRRTTCKGGDLNARLASGGIYAENKFCTYRNFKLYGITI